MTKSNSSRWIRSHSQGITLTYPGVDQVIVYNDVIYTGVRESKTNELWTVGLDGSHQFIVHDTLVTPNTYPQMKVNDLLISRHRNLDFYDLRNRLQPTPLEILPDGS